MIDWLVPLLQVALLLAMGVLFIGLCVWALAKVLETFGQPIQGPKHKLVGQLGRVTAPIADTQRGKVVVFGEVWDALPAEALQGETLEPDDEIRVTGFDAVDPKVLRVTRVRLPEPPLS